MQAGIGGALLALGLTGAVWLGSSLTPSSGNSGMAGGMMMSSITGHTASQRSGTPTTEGMMDQCEAMMGSHGYGTMMSGGMMGR